MFTTVPERTAHVTIPQPTDPDGVVAAARRVRPYLHTLVGTDAPEVDLEISQLLGSAEPLPNVAAELCRVLEARDETQMFLDSVEEGAAADISVSSAEAISDEEIDRMIEAEEQVEDAREAQQMSALRAELAQLKGESAKESK